MPNIIYGDREIAPRPTMYSREVAEEVFEAIKGELQELGYLDRLFETMCRKQFVDAVMLMKQYDGYTLTKYLDTHHLWGGSFALVELFENAPWSSIHADHVRKWIAYFHIEPLFKPGDKVIARHGGMDFTTTVRSIAPHAPGCYQLNPIDPESKSYPVVRWEDCKAVEA